VIHELDRRRFGRIRGLLEHGIRFPEVLSVVEGHSPGWVFADDPHQPATALVWVKGMQGFYLVGDERNSAFLEGLNAIIDRAIVPRARSLGLRWFQVNGHRQEWNEAIERVFEHRGLEHSVQFIYTLDPTSHAPLPEAPDPPGCVVRKVDRDLISGSPLGSLEFVTTRILSSWGDIEAFLSVGTGYVLAVGGELASVCFSGYVAGDTHAVSIETAALHRRRGYGEAVARAFIGECVARGLTPHWDCMQANIGSARLAEKLGLTRSQEYILYSFYLRGVEPRGGA
jgi:GNAT superfamily N-acetyltransferase